MSNVVRSEGLVLRTRPFRESSKIVAVLSRKSGRVDFLARGARKPGTRFGAALEMGTQAEFIYYERENVNLWMLSSADILASHQSVREDAESLPVLAKIVKLLMHVSHPGEANISLYNLTLAVLNALEVNAPAPFLYDLFLWRAVAAIGFPPRIDEGCIVCGGKDAARFSVPQGGYVCDRHASQGADFVRLTVAERLVLNRLGTVSPSEWGAPVPAMVTRLVRLYARYHLHSDERVIG